MSGLWGVDRQRRRPKSIDDTAAKQDSDDRATSDPKTQKVLDLQQSAGNAAVTGAVQESLWGGLAPAGAAFGSKDLEVDLKAGAEAAGPSGAKGDVYGSKDAEVDLKAADAGTWGSKEDESGLKAADTWSDASVFEIESTTDTRNERP